MLSHNNQILSRQIIKYILIQHEGSYGTQQMTGGIQQRVFQYNKVSINLQYLSVNKQQIFISFTVMNWAAYYQDRLPEKDSLFFSFNQSFTQNLSKLNETTNSCAKIQQNSLQSYLPSAYISRKSHRKELMKDKQNLCQIRKINKNQNASKIVLNMNNNEIAEKESYLQEFSEHYASYIEDINSYEELNSQIKHQNSKLMKKMRKMQRNQEILKQQIANLMKIKQRLMYQTKISSFPSSFCQSKISLQTNQSKLENTMFALKIEEQTQRQDEQSESLLIQNINIFDYEKKGRYRPIKTCRQLKENVDYNKVQCLTKR